MEQPTSPPDQCDECGEEVHNGLSLCRWCLREQREQDRLERERDER